MRRTVLLLASTALAVLLASGVALAATNEFSNPVRITIPDKGAATPYPSAIPVSGLGTVTDVDLKLKGFSHEYPRDVNVELVGPSGASAMVMARVGDSETSNADLTFDDEATSGLPYGSFSSGSFRPSSPLSVFDGTNPNGVWELYIDDMAGGDLGSVSGGWSLTITSEGAEQPLPTDTTPPNTRLLEPLPSALSGDASPRFSFRSSETNSTFECKMDGNPFQTCPASKQYFLLAEGEHTLQVRAKDASGNTDQTPAQHTWTVDSKGPSVAFTHRPGTATGPDRWDEWVTNDRSPTWAWTIQDLHLDPTQMSCDLDEDQGDYRNILYIEPCSSPFTFEGELPDGDYSFDVGAYDEAGNYGDAYNEFEVDTVVPKFVSGRPTGKRASNLGEVTVTFDDSVHNSKQFVNIYKKGSSKPLEVWRYDGSKQIELSTKRLLARDTWYTVKVTTGVTDGANNLEAPTTWNFKTK